MFLLAVNSLCRSPPIRDSGYTMRVEAIPLKG